MQTSPLQAAVRDGLAAIENRDVGLIDKSVRAVFADSLDLDDAFRVTHPREPRWDYLLGHGQTESIVALEAHSARQDQVSAVIQKRTSAIEQLRRRIKRGARVARWLWVASGRTDFADTEKARRQLDQNGITFVGRTVREKHLPSARGSAKGDPGR